MKQYLITTTEAYAPFLTDYYDPENNFNADVGMVVYDLYRLLYTTDGTTWKEIPEDHL